MYVLEYKNGVKKKKPMRSTQIVLKKIILKLLRMYLYIKTNGGEHQKADSRVR